MRALISSHKPNFQPTLKHWLLLLLCTVLALCAISLNRMAERLLTEQLSSRNIKSRLVRVDLLGARATILRVEMPIVGGMGHVMVDRIDVKYPWRMLWKDGLSSVNIHLNRARVHLELGEQRRSSTSIGLPAHGGSSLFERFHHSFIEWDGVEFSVRNGELRCNGTLGRGGTGHRLQPLLLHGRCAGGDGEVRADVALDLRAFPTRIVLNLPEPIRWSERSLSIRFDEAFLQSFSKPVFTVMGLEMFSPRVDLSVDSVSLSRRANGVFAKAEGGFIHMRTLSGNGGSSDSVPTNSGAPKSDGLKVLDWFQVLWSGISLRLDGTEILTIPKFELAHRRAHAELARGASRLSLSLGEINQDLMTANLKMTGDIQLEDIDILWPSSAMVDGGLSIDLEYRFSTQSMSGNLLSEGIRVLHPSLALMPFHMPRIQTKFDGRFERKSRAFELRGSIDVGGLNTVVSFKSTENFRRYDLKLAPEEGDCSQLQRLLPLEWREAFGLELYGQMKPSVRLEGHLDDMKSLKFRLRGLMERCRVKAVNIPWDKTQITLVQPDLSHVKVAKNADLDVLNGAFVKRLDRLYAGSSEITVGPAADNYWMLAELPKHVAGIMYLSEEVDFYRNYGIDLGLIQRALGLDLAHGRYVYGGSTVTQQLVKNLILDRRKTLRRKVHEMLIADRMFQRVSKERVLELYINVIEFAPKIFGIGPAAQFYFQKTPRELTINEAIFLSMLKPSPSRGETYRRRGKTPEHAYWFVRSKQLLERLVEYEYLSAEAAARIPPLRLRWDDGIYVPATGKNID